MTTQQKRAVTVGVLTTVLGAGVLFVTGAAWNAKVDRSEFDLHVQAEANNHERQMELSLELLCEMKPANRRCR